MKIRIPRRLRAEIAARVAADFAWAAEQDRLAAEWRPPTQEAYNAARWVVEGYVPGDRETARRVLCRPPTDRVESMHAARVCHFDGRKLSRFPLHDSFGRPVFPAQPSRQQERAKERARQMIADGMLFGVRSTNMGDQPMDRDRILFRLQWAADRVNGGWIAILRWLLCERRARGNRPLTIDGDRAGVAGGALTVY